MTNFNADRETLRELADAGKERALERLADLADERDDLDELSDLLGRRLPPSGKLADPPGGRHT